MEDTLYNIEEILDENRRRLALQADDRYDPLTGVGCWGDRVDVDGCLVPRAVLPSSRRRRASGRTLSSGARGV